MPALLTRMSSPPNSRAHTARDSITEPSSVTLQTATRTASLPYLAARSAWACCNPSASISVGPAPRAASKRAPAGANADPPRPAGDEGDARRQGFRLGHAAQLGLFQGPVFDVEGFLLGERNVF